MPATFTWTIANLERNTSDDGVEISRSFSRHVVAPDADITGESTEVQAISNAVHTQAVKDAYAAHLAAQAV